MITDDRLIFLIFKAQNKLQNYIRSQLAAAGVKITITQSGVLFLLKQRNGRNMTELSRILSTDNSAITGLVNRLQKLGLIVRKADPDDRRTCLVYITPAGLEEIDKAKGIIRRVNDDIKQGFTTEEIGTLKRALNGIFERFAGNG